MQWFLFILFSGISIANATGLSPTELALTQYITSSKQAQLALLARLVNINSGTANVEGVYQVGEILKQQFAALGFNTSWVSLPQSMQRTGTLLATHIGTRGKRLLLIGHLDTVFPPDSPFRRYKQTGPYATGPGVIDDKGGDVVLLFALKALKAAHALDDANITVILTGDEEDAGKPISVSRKALLAAATGAEVALEFEWSFTLNTATTARRGISHWIMNTQGKEAHSSVIFSQAIGDGAIFELARILNDMRQVLSNEANISFNPGLMIGGTLGVFYPQAGRAKVFGKDNVVAKMAMVSGDLRYLTPEQKIKAEEKMKLIVSQHLPQTMATIRFEDSIPAMMPTAANNELLNQYSHASIELGFGPVHAFDPDQRGAGDISYIASIVPACLAGLGPVGTGAHTTNETLDIHSLPIQTKRAALLIYRLIK